jgi:AcrR family transcriptional regulator
MPGSRASRYIIKRQLWYPSEAPKIVVSECVTTGITPKKRVQDRGLATKQKILDEALEQFSQRGFDAVGIREIADAVGVQHGLIKYHFGTKDQLWREAVEFLFSRLHRILTVPPEERTLPPAIITEKLIRRYVRYCAEHPEHARLMAQESFRDSDRLKWAAETFIRPSHDHIVPDWESLMAEKVMPKIDPVLLIYALTGAAQSIFNIASEAKYSHSINPLSDEIINKYADAIITLFMPGRPQN